MRCSLILKFSKQDKNFCSTTTNLSAGTKNITYFKKWIKTIQRCEACEHNWPMYEFMTKSVSKPGVTAKALHHIKKMYSTISKLSTVDFQEGHYGR